MPRSFVVDASPLILLARIRRLDLLALLAKSLLVPETVLREVEAGEARDGAATAVRAFEPLQIVSDLEIPESIRLVDLGAGESQVLAHAARGGREAILDDLAARSCARSLGIPVLGTLGVVITCRHLDLIPAARPVLDGLRQAGMRLKSSLMEAALTKVGETRSVGEKA